jgi:hypothetical protein
MKETNVKIWVGVIALSLASIIPAAASPTLSVIQDFNGTNGATGNDPNAMILASDGNFYGITYLHVGTVFQVTPAGQFTTIFSLPPNNPNRFFYGDFFTGIVEGSDGLLYVTARGSNQNPNPMVFRISKSGTGFQVVLNFAPIDLSAASDGNLYGTTGGVGAGQVFRLSTSGTYTVLSTNSILAETLNKQATDGNFYGTCYGGSSGSPYQVCRVTTSGQVTPILQFPGGLYSPSGILTQGVDGLLYGVAGPVSGTISVQTVFQLSTSGVFREVYQINNWCNAKTGCSMVLPASDGNLWIADPPADSVYAVTTGGVLLETVSFSSQPNPYAHPQLLVQAPSGVLFGTTGEPNPAFNDAGSVFSINAGLPPRR